jgi:hypothetical protein
MHRDPGHQQHILTAQHGSRYGPDAGEGIGWLGARCMPSRRAGAAGWDEVKIGEHVKFKAGTGDIRDSPGGRGGHRAALLPARPWPGLLRNGMMREVQQQFETGAETSTAAAARPTAGEDLRVGGFRFWFVGQRWEWSDEVARMHGYEPGTVVPTTELLLSHKHPDDRAHVQDLLDHALYSQASLSSRHRFLDTAGHVHDAIVVADRMRDDSGAVVGTEGYYIDLTETLDEARAETRTKVLDESLPELYDARAAIEQAKGALMLVYRVTADHAFRILKWRSQETNTKLRDLSAQLVAELPTLAPTPTDVQSQFDHLLLTVHKRVPDDPAR